jgi:hypothetical protein
MQIGEQDDRIQAPAGASKPRISRHAERNVSDTTEHLELPQRIRVRAPGLRVELATAEKSIRFIDKNVPRELATLPRWTFARALLVEALRIRERPETYGPRFANSRRHFRMNGGSTPSEVTKNNPSAFSTN